jgi:hypothetical protein
MRALDLAWQTVGTADVPETVVHARIAELLTSPTWRVLTCANSTAHKAILDIAELHRAAVSADMPAVADWDAAGDISPARIARNDLRLAS